MRSGTDGSSASGAGAANLGRLWAMTRVLFADDHQMVAAGLAAAVGDEDGIEVVGIAGTLSAALDMARALTPDVVVLDYRLPDGDGAQGTRQLRALPSPPQVVVLTAAADDRMLREALSAGCCGFLTKGGDLDDLTGAIRAAAAGEAVFSPDVVARLARLSRGDPRPEEALSPRELGVLRAMARGATSTEIARELSLSEHTVRNHIRNVLAKLGAHTKLEAVVAAARAGLVDLNGP
jgi:DNA-binding NarL/FixJ family response regulator